MDKAGIGLVVVGYDSGDVWAEFFSSLPSSSVVPSHIVVVENSPVLPRDLRKMWTGALTVVHRPENPGFGTSCNEGVNQLPENCDPIVVCNPDVVFREHTLRDLEQALNQNAHVGVVGPRILNRDGSVYPSARAFPGIRVGVGHALFADVWKSNPWTRRYLGTYQRSEPRIVDWLSGALLMIRRTAFQDVGGFDAGYFMFFEDVDLCFRLKSRGWRSLFVPRAEIVHSGAHSTSKNMAEMVRVHHESAARFLDRLYSKPLERPLRMILHLGLRIRKVLAARKYEQTRSA